MMKADEFAGIAESFLNVPTCYLLGFWGQYLSLSEYNRVNNLDGIKGKNDKFNNKRFCGTNVFAFDCINYIKGLLAGTTTKKRVDYNAIKNCPIGDCRNDEFLAMMQKSGVKPKDATRGMGLATSGHAAIALGGGKWIDANFTGSQNGVAIHTTGIDQFTAAGYIDGIDYTEASDIQIGDIMEMEVYEIRDGFAYGKVPISVPVPKQIEPGSKVTINKGAKAGGTNPDYRGKYINEAYTGGKFVDTVDRIETHYGNKEALLKALITWVALESLTLVE